MQPHNFYVKFKQDRNIKYMFLPVSLTTCSGLLWQFNNKIYNSREMSGKYWNVWCTQWSWYHTSRWESKHNCMFKCHIFHDKLLCAEWIVWEITWCCSCMAWSRSGDVFDKLFCDIYLFIHMLLTPMMRW